MASTGKCPFCGAVVTSDQKVCPSCGGKNENYIEDHPRRIIHPKTIAELKEYCAERGMPLLRMRFFIGENYQEPRAFGIYQSGNIFTVYKNKADGSRSIRYSGPDEAYAVNELYEKLLEEHRLRQGGSSGHVAGAARSGARRRNSRLRTLLIVAIILVVLLYQFAGTKLIHRKDGYYRWEDRTYYRYGSSWYVDSDYYDDWVETDSFPLEDYGSYYLGDDYDDSWGGSDFTESSAWSSIQDSDSDSDWDTDYSDWDSGDTDWDSDW